MKFLYIVSLLLFSSPLRLVYTIKPCLPAAEASKVAAKVKVSVLNAANEGIFSVTTVPLSN